jgi:hypothetical protein
LLRSMPDEFVAVEASGEGAKELAAGSCESEFETECHSMSSKRRIRRKSCGGKVRYAAQSAAQIQANRMWRNGSKVRPYKCGFCHGWHNGHMRKQDKMRIAGESRRYEMFQVRA